MKFKYKKYIYISSFSAMMLGMMIFSTLPFDKKGEKKDGVEVSSGSSIRISSEEKTVSGTAVSVGELKKDAYPEVNQLIKSYFDALLKIDKDEIKEYVDKVEYVGIEKLPKRVKDIESIEGVVCYTIDGPEANSYIVYVYNEVKFKNIKTGSTALDGFYVKKDEDGRLRIILSQLSPEIQKIIDEDSKRKDVEALIVSVNEKLTKEIKSDKQLAALLKRMREDELKEEMEGHQDKVQAEEKNND